MHDTLADTADSSFRYEQAINFACAVVQRDRAHLTVRDLATALGVAERDLLAAEVRTLTVLIEFSSLRNFYCGRRTESAMEPSAGEQREAR
jgi:hypothetical protein